MAGRWGQGTSFGRSRGAFGRGGFSTIELLLVIAIIGLLVAIVVPRVDRVRYQMDSGVQNVATAMLAAQRAAVTEEHDVAVSFDVPNRRVNILYDTDNNGVANGTERVRQITLEPDLAFSRGGATPRGMGTSAISFTRTVGGLPAVIFHRNGSASSAGGFYLTSRRAVADSGYRTDTRALEVVRATGRTEWWRFDGTTWKRGF